MIYPSILCKSANEPQKPVSHRMQTQPDFALLDPQWRIEQDRLTVFISLANATASRTDTKTPVTPDSIASNNI